MNLIQRLFGKTKPEPKVKSKPKTGAAKAGGGKSGTAKPKKPKAAAPAPTPAPAPEAGKAPEIDATMAALLKNIEARRSTDPMAGVKVCATEILNRLILAMRDPKGVQAESMLSALGAIGGFACQMSARAQNQPLERREANKHFYFFGPAINGPLSDGKFSILALAMGAAETLGVQGKPDIEAIYKHAIDTMGMNTYALPRVPEKHKARDLPENYARALWPVLLPTIKIFCPDPAEWPIVFGYAIQQVMNQSKAVLPPSLAVMIVMESAIPVSKLDPGSDLADLI